LLSGKHKSNARKSDRYEQASDCEEERNPSSETEFQSVRSVFTFVVVCV